MLRIDISAESVEQFRTHVADLYSMVFGALGDQALTPAQIAAVTRQEATTTESPSPTPAKRTRAKKADAPAEQAAPVETQQAPAPTAESLPAKQPEQKDLISAFRALNEKKGTNAIVGLLGKFGAKTVALIPKDKWAEAIAEANKLAA